MLSFLAHSTLQEALSRKVFPLECLCYLASIAKYFMIERRCIKYIRDRFCLRFRRGTGTFIEKGVPTVILSNPLVSKETISGKGVHVPMEQSIIMKLLAREEVNPTEILEWLRTKFGGNTLTRSRLNSPSQGRVLPRKASRRSANRRISQFGIVEKFTKAVEVTKQSRLMTSYFEKSLQDGCN